MSLVAKFVILLLALGAFGYAAKGRTNPGGVQAQDDSSPYPPKP